MWSQVKVLPNVRNTLVNSPMLRTSSDRRIKNLIKVVIVRKNDVSTHIKEKSFRSYIRHRQTSSLVEGINEKPIFVFVLLQSTGSTETGWTSSNNKNINFLHISEIFFCPFLAVMRIPAGIAHVRSVSKICSYSIK